jgi:hypothetical protein
MDDEGQNAGMESVEGVHRGTGFACADVKKRLAAIHMALFLIVQAGLINILASQQSHILLVEHQLHEYSNKSIISMCGAAT